MLRSILCYMRYERWVRIVLFNFFLVALLGLVMRYKIAWSLPWVHQKHLLHAHSHFAFSGWVSLALYLAIVRLLFPVDLPGYIKKCLLLHWFASLGMLFTFPFMGYAGPSIFFSTLTIVTGYTFFWILWKPLKNLGEAGLWIRIGLVSNVISSLGTFFLAWLMQQPGFSQEWYVFAVYFFLHFQYNGWFFFTIIGLYIRTVSDTDSDSSITSKWRKIRILLTIALLPALFLSALWMRLPQTAWFAATVAALIQLVAMVLMIQVLKIHMPTMSRQVKWLWSTAFLAFCIKIVLQVLSCLPGMSVFAFGYRPLVIAYLHLVLLGFVSLFLIGYFVYQGWQRDNWGVSVVWLAVMLNEVVLIVQGLSAIGLIAVPYANEMLFINTFLLVVGAGRMYRRQ
jgi:hypothetical protein